MTPANALVSRMLGAFALGLFHLGAYYVATRVTVWRGPQALVDTHISLDPLVPHLPWAWPLYWLPYVFVFGLGVAALVLMPRASYRRAILAYAGMIVIGASIQMVFPALAPWPDGPAVSQRVFHESPLVLPYATLPSMHVAFTTLTSLIVLSVFHQRVIRAWAWAMPPMVIVATLVLKEHVMLDAVAGGLLAGVAFWWWRAPSRQTVDHPDESTSRDGSNGGQHTLGLSIAPVEKKGRKEFFRVPWRVYRGNPCWSPPFPGEERRLLDPHSNPDLAEVKHRLWIAKTADGPVGRIAAFAPHLSPDIGYFGFFESVPEPEVAARLFAAAEAWLRTLGVRRVLGPITINPRDTIGLLTEGFDQPATIQTPYHAPYYADLLRRGGYRPTVHLRAYQWNPLTTDRLGMIDMDSRLQSRDRITIRPIDSTRLEDESVMIAEIINEAFTATWGYVPVTPKQARSEARRLAPVLDPRLVLIAERRGEPAGVVVAVPDINWLTRRMGGRWWPFGWATAWRFRRRIPAARVMVFAVRPGRRATGIAVRLIVETHRAMRAAGYRTAELSQVFDENPMVTRLLDRMALPVSKRYVVYERTL